MWELNHKEGWMPKNWCFWIVMLEKTIKPVNLKGNQPWILIGRTDAEKLKLHNFGHLMRTADSLEKWDWGQKEKASEDEMVGWYHQCNGHELRQSLGDGEGSGGLAYCNPWGHIELDTTGWLISNNRLWPFNQASAHLTFSIPICAC